jgi:hypothetical protein
MPAIQIAASDVEVSDSRDATRQQLAWEKASEKSHEESTLSSA